MCVFFFISECFRGQNTTMYVSFFGREQQLKASSPNQLQSLLTKVVECSYQMMSPHIPFQLLSNLVTLFELDYSLYLKMKYKISILTFEWLGILNCLHYCAISLCCSKFFFTLWNTLISEKLGNTRRKLHCNMFKRKRGKISSWNVGGD